MATEPYDWEVRRRLSDFRWLSERLRREFPQINIRLFNCETVKDIEDYVNSLLKVPIILKSRFFIFFLSCSNLTKFYERREKEFKQNVIKSISKKFEGMMDTSSSKQDGKMNPDIFNLKATGALNIDQTLHDISASDANILKALGGDLN